MNNNWIIEKKYANARLDKFLVEQLPTESRSKLQKKIAAGGVTVNDVAVNKHHFLNVGDVVKMIEVEEQAVDIQADAQDIPILYEDDAIVVIDKPVGVLVHPVPHRKQWTLVDWILERYPEVAGVGEDDVRPGIVHRLDREVSGVLLIRKTAEAHHSIKQQFMKRIVKKDYRAIVYGVPSLPSDVIKFGIAHSKTKQGKMAAKPEHEAAKDAWTEFDVIEAKHNRYALLAVRIKTGRTHQIRAHLAAIDHPVVGDTIYMSKHYRGQKPAPRLFLHALNLEIIHPTTGEKIAFEAPLPSAFAEFLG